MFLLFLIGLGTADVNAQVRIGGNSVPQGAAVLDLNADNTATPAANKGALALPRVRLDSTTMRLNGTAPIAGMLVWNTNTALGAGIYFWSGSAWVKSNLPGTVPADTGKILVSNGTNWVIANQGPTLRNLNDTVYMATTQTPVSFSIVLDTFYTVDTVVPVNTLIRVNAPGILLGDICTTSPRFNTPGSIVAIAIGNAIDYWTPARYAITPGLKIAFRCVRAKI